jgi:small-conductance mechanosensitive channel
MKKRYAALLFFLLIVTLFWFFFLGGIEIYKDLPREYTETFLLLLGIIVGLTILYRLGTYLLKSTWTKLGAKEGESVMIQGLYKFFLIIVGFLAIVTQWFSLGTLGAIFAAFGGMFLGWSLQGPISGIAAWLLVSAIRPFSVGDRVQLPSFSLVGDVISVSPLYTTLNQVGGSISSEEPANRTVLIPNAMLFGALIINYTPKEQQELFQKSKQRLKTRSESAQTSYMLDEFVLRLSFDSDWDEAENLLLKVAKEVTADIIKATKTEPYIRADMSDWYGAYLRLRFMTLATDRPKIMHEIAKRVFKGIQSSKKVDLAIPYIYSYRKGYQWAPPYSLDNLQTIRDSTKEKLKNTLICPKCKSENFSDAKYCNQCSEKLIKVKPK